MHHKKEYFDYDIDQEVTVTYLDVFEFLFGFDLTQYNYFIQWSGFPHTVDEEQKNATKITINDYDVHDFYDYLSHSDAVIWTNFNRKLADESSPADFICKFNGNLYVVKNKFERENNSAIFCEEVYAFANLLISINEGTGPNNETVIYITQRKHQFK